MVQNGAPLGQMIIELGLETSAFSSSLTGATRATKTAVREMASGFKVLDSGGKKIDALSFKQQALNKVITAQKNELGYLKQAYDKTLDSQGNATSTTAKAAQKYNEAQAKLAGYEAQLQTTSGQLARLKVETQGVTGWMNSHADSYIKQGEAIAKLGSNISKAGTALTVGVTAPIVAGVAAVTKAAVDWESAFAGVKKTNEEVKRSNGQVVYSYADLESGLRNLSKELPSSHTQIAAVAEAAGQLGIKTQDVVGFTKVMLDMGESTNLSAEDAATAIAKIANITGLTNDEYQRFGSSVVALGNNFATTESDIVDMTNRLASAGTLAGLTNQEILGLATAMSSVGIDAEAGGTAMTQTLTAIEQAAASGGEQLDKFANIAGMSSEQFANTWKSKPIEAIQAFIKGLGELDSKGESATLVLDEMGLSGVRQSNMLKSLALASDTMTSAVDTSNKAWSENTALTKEANTRYETTESKLKMLKNEINDTAIDLGGPFVDALRNGLAAIKPTIEYLGELAKKFNSLDTEQQQNIIKWIGIAAAAGPALKLLGGGVSIIGNTRKGIGLLSKSLVELAAKAAERSAITATTTAVTGLGTASATAGGASGVGALAAGLGAIAGPAAIAVGAVAAVGIAAYAGVKAYEAHQLAGAKWGTEVTKEQDKVIEKSYELREKAVGYVNEYADGIQSSAKKAIKANEDIVTSIENTLKKERERDEKAAQGLYSEAAQKRAQDYLEGQKALDEENVALATKTTNRINEILKSASDNNRQLSDEERQYIAANYNRLSDAQLKAAGFTKNQRIAIESAYQTDLSKLTTKELQTRAENVVNALGKEQSSYEKQKNKLAEIYGKGTKNYKSELAKLNEATKQSNESMILGLAKLTLQQGFSLDQMSGAWTKYGYTTEEVAALVASSNTKTTQNLDMLAKATNEAGIAWNQLALDPKTGEVKTNMADTLVEMAKTDDGWKQLQFMAKNADISTNAKEEIAIAMGEAGKWQFLTIEDKKLLVNGDEAQIALYDTIDKMGLWNQYNADRKTLGIDNADAAWKLAESNNMIAQWNGLPVEQKTMLADNQDLLNKVLSSQENYNAWIALPDNLKQMLGDNSDIVAKLTSGEIALDEYARNNPALKQLLGDAVNIQAATSAGEQALNGYAGNNPASKALNGNSSGVQNASKSGEDALNSFSRNNPVGKTLRAIDNASGPASSATSGVREFAKQRDHTVTLTSVVKNVTQWITEKFTKNEKGTNYHPGGLAMVNDQKGPLYKELVQYPNGELFMPNGRNVMLDLPRGTKVVKASQTRNLMVRAGIPNYAQGVGIPRDSELVRNLESVSGNNNTSKVIVNSNNEATERKLDQLIAIMSQFGNDLKNLKLEANGKNLAEVVENERNFRASMIAKARG